MINKIFRTIYPQLTIFFFSLFFVNRLFLDNFLFYGEERGFLNYDFANYHYKSLWEASRNFGAITSNHLNVFTTGLFWKITTFFNLSWLDSEKLFYFFIIFLTTLSAYLVFKKVSQSKKVGLLMSLIYITTYNYYATITTTPKLLQFLIIPLSLYLWMSFYETKKLRYLILNTISVVLLLGIGINPPQMIGAYAFLFIYILIFNFKKENIVTILLFTFPYVLSILFVFLINTLVIVNSLQVIKFDLFNSSFFAPNAVVYEVLRFFGGWWDYAGSGGLFYNHIGDYYHSIIGIVMTFVPLIVLVYLLKFQTRATISNRNKLLVLCIVMLFLTKGGAMPFGQLFSKTYESISVFKIFREPWAKFIADFIFAIYLSIGYFLYSAPGKAKKYVLYFLTVLLLFQIVPLGLKKVIDHRNISWKISDVQIPEYWKEFSKWTKENSQDKRILILPAIISDKSNPGQVWDPYLFIGYPDNFFIYGDIISGQFNDDEDRYITQNYLKNLNSNLVSFGSVDYILNKNDVISEATAKLKTIDSVKDAIDDNATIQFGRLSVIPVKKSYQLERIRTVKNIKTGSNNCTSFFYHEKNSDFADTAFVHNSSINTNTTYEDNVQPTVKKISNTAYEIDFKEDATKTSALYFNETFSNGWQLYDSGGLWDKPITDEYTHVKANCFANLWLLSKDFQNKHHHFYLRFTPDILYQQMEIIFALLLLITLLFATIYLFKFRKKDKDPHSTLSFISPNKVMKTLYEKFHPSQFGVFKTEQRLLFLLGTVLLIIFDFFNPHWYFDFFVILFSFVWICMISAYKLNPKVNIYISWAFLFLTILCRLVGFMALSEKMSVWVVMFLVYVLIYSVIYDYLLSEKINTYDAFLNKVRSDVVYFEKSKFPPLVFLLRILHRSLINIRNTIVSVYGNKFKSKHDYSILTLKLVITLFILFVGFTIYRKIDSKINRLAFNPVISKYEPKIDYQSTTVLIRGKGFGTPETSGSVLMSQYGPIRTSSWTESTITFDIPLSWKPGKVRLWIAKPINYEGKDVVATSKPFELTIIPRHSKFTKDDDLFFQQIKDLEPLTKKLNGYE